MDPLKQMLQSQYPCSVFTGKDQQAEKISKATKEKEELMNIKGKRQEEEKGIGRSRSPNHQTSKMMLSVS